MEDQGRIKKNKEKSGTEYYIFSETAKENSVYFTTKPFFAVRSGINAILTLLQRQPAIFCPVDFLLNQNAGTILRHTVTMAEEVIAIREGVG